MVVYACSTGDKVHCTGTHATIAAVSIQIVQICVEHRRSYLMHLYITFLLMLVQVKNTDAWNCGIGPVSGAVSYLIAFPGDSIGVDHCCTEHDALIDDLHVAREEADRVFCQCLARKENWYTRHIVKPLFCTSVMLYTKWFEREETKEIPQ